MLVGLVYVPTPTINLQLFLDKLATPQAVWFTPPPLNPIPPKTTEFVEPASNSLSSPPITEESCELTSIEFFCPPSIVLLF